MPKSELEQYKQYVSTRLNQIFPFLQEYAIGDFSKRIEIPEEEDEFTELLVGLSLMVDDIRESIEREADILKGLTIKVTGMIDAIQKLARGDYSVQIELSGKNDVLDSLAMGLNMMIDDIRNGFEEVERARMYTNNIITSMADALVVVNPDATIRTVNRATEELLGYEENELVGQPVDMVLEEKDSIFGGDGFAELMDKGFIKDSDMSFITKGKEGIPVSFSAAIMRNRKGQLVGTVCVAKDLRHIKELIERDKRRLTELEKAHQDLQGTQDASLNIMEDLQKALSEREQAEKAVHKSERRYRLLAENVADAIWTTDMIGRFTYISPSVQNLLGYAPNELVDMKWKDYMTPPSMELSLKKLEEELTLGDMALDPSKSVTLELELVRKDGSTVWTETEMTYLCDEDGQLRGFLGVSRDVTVRRKIIEDLKQTNEELRNAQSQLIHSEKLASIGTLASGIAHEVNNPLAAITGYGEAILDEDDPATVRSYATKIVSAADRASDVVRWLSKHSRQTKDASIVDIHLDDVLTDSLEAMKLIRSSANIEIMTNYEEIPAIRGNRNELLQIFVNIMNNSADAMPEGGRITISTRGKGNLVEVEISDTGMGIPKEHAAQVFDPFFTTKEVGQGTGLGLYVASMIVRRHQGTIEVDSDVGKGATFTLRFPTKEYVSELRESMAFEKGNGGVGESS